jgi:dihydropyrimidinase
MAPTPDLLIRGGTVVSDGVVRIADVAVADGRIAGIGTGLDTNGAEAVDAAGLLVLPGAIDVHTHLRLPDAEHPDRFRRDTQAAAHGGTTTLLTFNNPGTGISDRGAGSLLQGLAEFTDRTTGEAVVDYGLCAVITGQQGDPVGELPELIEAGVPTFKAFMVYEFALPDDRLEAVMRTAARHGGMLQLHCEEPSIIDPLVNAALTRGDVGCGHQEGNRDGSALRSAALHRPPQLRGGARSGG